MIIKSFCSNLDICLNYYANVYYANVYYANVYYANVYFRSQSSVRGLSVADRAFSNYAFWARSSTAFVEFKIEIHNTRDCFPPHRTIVLETLATAIIAFKPQQFG